MTMPSGCGQVVHLQGNRADPTYGCGLRLARLRRLMASRISIRRGRTDVRRALGLDPCDPEAIRIMGSIVTLKENFRPSRQRSGRRLFELNPTDAFRQARCALVSTHIGEPARSLGVARRIHRSIIWSVW